MFRPLAETFLSAIDETYSSWMRDIRLAKSRIIVPAGYLASTGPGMGAGWEDREVYAPTDAVGGGVDGEGPQPGP
jgi:hypothetical protein